MMIGLLFVGLLGTFGYFLFDNGFNAFGVDFEGREYAAQIRQEKVNVERGGALYALYCRSCHGLTGQGALERGGLPGAPLNDPANRPPELTTALAGARQARLNKTIHCGRVGTVMPPWSTEEGGALNDFQIEQLVMLITSEFSEEGWDFAVEDGNHTDVFSPGKTIEEAIGEDDTTITLNDVSGIAVEGTLRMGGHTIEDPYEILLITEINKDDKTLEVERAVDNSTPLAHEAGEEVFNGPLPPGETITGDPESLGDPPCGQAKAQPAGTPAPPVEISGEVAIEMGDNFFAYEGANNPSFQVAVGDSISVALTNSGQAIHNMRIAGIDGEFSTDDDTVSDPDLIPGGSEGTLEFSFDEPGTYPYQCDFHPVQMLGEITVVE